MKLSNRLLLGAFVLLLVGSSCKKPVPAVVKHIPKTASFVAVLNTKAMQQKLLANQATIENIIKLAADSDTTLKEGKKEFDQLMESGLDFDQNMYMSIDSKGGQIGTGTSVIAAFASVKDQSKLEQYVKSKMPKADVRKEGNYSFVTTGGDQMVAWNSEMVVAMNYQQSGMQAMEFDSLGNPSFQNPVNKSSSLKTEMDGYFAMKETESVAGIPEFRETMQNSADATMWVNSGSSMEALPLPRVKELFGNSYTAAMLNFEDGKVVVDSKSYYSKEMRDLLKKYSSPEADMNMIERYPSANIDGFMAISINPEFINAIVTQLEMGGIVDAQLTKWMGSNFSLKDLLSALKGDIAVIVSDMKAGPDTVDPAMGKPGTDMKVLANIAIGDKAQMNRIMNRLVEMKIMDKTPGGYSMSTQMMGKQVSGVVDDKNIVIASDGAVLGSYKAGNGKAGLSSDVMKDFKGKQAAVYVDLQAIMAGMKDAATADSAVGVAYSNAQATFKDLKMYSDKLSSGTVDVHYELNMMNSKENSMASLLHFAEAAARADKMKKAEPVRFQLGPEAVPSMRP